MTAEHEKYRQAGGGQTVTFSPSKGKLALTVIGCAAFVAVAVAMLVSGVTPFEAFIAVVGILFFGGGGGWMLWKLARAKTVLVLSPGGVHPISGGLIPWQDIEGVGMGRTSGTAIIGIRLNSYDRYVASLTPAETALAVRTARAGKAFGSVTAPFLGRRGTGAASLTEIPSSGGDVAALLEWARNNSGGFDISFSPMLFDRPGPQVVEAIAAYHSAWAASNGPDETHSSPS
jgi:hypothetical protein